MLRLKLNHVSKRGHRRHLLQWHGINHLSENYRQQQGSSKHDWKNYLILDTHSTNIHEKIHIFNVFIYVHLLMMRVHPSGRNVAKLLAPTTGWTVVMKTNLQLSCYAISLCLPLSLALYLFPSLYIHIYIVYMYMNQLIKMTQPPQAQARKNMTTMRKFDTSNFTNIWSFVN